ncbi:MAG: hypothetical protein WCO45_14740 [Pseudanabaena sp. ELA607]
MANSINNQIPNDHLENHPETLSCKHCEGKGYIAIRDCSAEIQREETCSFCHGRGEILLEIDDN